MKTKTKSKMKPKKTMTRKPSTQPWHPTGSEIHIVCEGLVSFGGETWRCQKCNKVVGTNETRLAKEFPTLAQIEKAIGAKTATWEGRCYEISCAIIKAGLIRGEAVYGHWVGDVHPKSMFATKSTKLPFVPHGWILMGDGRVVDPTRWVFEHVEPYLFVGEPPDNFDIHACTNCGLLEEEHRDSGPEDRCELYEFDSTAWPYDEGGNKWREFAHRTPPKPEGQRTCVDLKGFTKTWVGAVLGEGNASQLTVDQMFFLANMSYDVMFRQVGPSGVKEIYDMIADQSDSSISWIPYDNAMRAKRECKFERE